MNRVLIIEDDKNLSETISFLLEDAGIRYGLAYSEKEAHKELFSKDYSAVILDLIFAESEDICKEIDGIPLLLLTACSERALEADAFDYIRKPFDNEELVLKVREMMKEH